MKPTPVEAPLFTSRAIYSDIYPLDEFCAARGQDAVERARAFHRIANSELPTPYRSLLDHKTDMTSTLERFHGESLHVEVLNRHVHDNEYFREVVLVLDQSGKRVEFGAIKINLNLFPSEAQQEILREKKPLGRILHSFNISYASKPSAFLRVSAEPFLVDALQLSSPQFLYGRRNSLLDSWEQPLAEIVEILPPC